MQRAGRGTPSGERMGDLGGILAQRAERGRRRMIANIHVQMATGREPIRRSTAVHLATSLWRTP